MSAEPRAAIPDQIRTHPRGAGSFVSRRGSRVAHVRRGGMAAAVLASILTGAVGCDKARALTPREARAEGAVDSPAAAAAPESLDVHTNARVLFQVFGAKDSPRMLPLALLDSGRLHPIQLSPAGWRAFDSAYFRAGTSYALYTDGTMRGQVRVRRGMWAGADDPMYSLDGCRTPVPIASVTLEGTDFPTRQPMVELLASSATLGRAQPGAAQEVAQPETVREAVGVAAKLRPQTIGTLDFRALAVPTGATPEPTLVAVFLDRVADTATSPDAMARHIFVIADRDGAGYRASYVHRSLRSLAHAEFRRYLDHLDLTGDGVDELVLEGWRYRGSSFLSVLSYDRATGRWREIFRSPESWCVE